MLFNSYIFIFGFLPIALIVFFGLSRLRYFRLAVIWLAIASLFFYAYWNPAYLPLLLISIGFNYLVGSQINRVNLKSKIAKSLLWIGIIGNLGILGYYKYAGFFVSTLRRAVGTDWTVPDIVLPLAISFYTFTQIAYLVDTYRGETQHSHYDFVTYGVFVCFFPQLIAGPILRHDELIPQFRKLENFVVSYRNIILGLTLFILGLSKKVLIADNLSPWVSPVFDHADTINFTEAWIGALSYTFQLYFDFSGYSDMAIGLGWMFNIQLPINFDSPYKAISIIDFWRRWHITLSNFLRDYLYIPLGGNRYGEIRRYGNLLITMLLGGLWHGAAWIFVIWGGWHGILLAINHGWRKFGVKLPKVLGVGMTFVAVVMGWVLFRSYSLTHGLKIIQTMLGLDGVELPRFARGILGWSDAFGVRFLEWSDFNYLPSIGGLPSLIILTALLLGVIFLPNTQQIMKHFQPRWWMAWFVSTLAVFCLLSLNRVSEFLYFQF